jgi:excisionase family DNA binding protein
VVITATEEFLSPEAVGERLGISVYTVRRWIKTGQLRAFKPGKEYRIQASDLEEFLRAREVRPKAPRRSPSEPSLLNGLEEERRLRSWIAYVSRRVEWCEKVVERDSTEEWPNPWLSLESAIQWAIYVAVESVALRDTINTEVLPQADALTDEADELRALLNRFRQIEDRTDERVRAMMEEAGLDEEDQERRLRLIEGAA